MNEMTPHRTMIGMLDADWKGVSDGIVRGGGPLRR